MIAAGARLRFRDVPLANRYKNNTGTRQIEPSPFNSVYGRANPLDPPSPMTRTKLEFVEQDPLVKELSEHHKQQHENIRDQRRGLLRDSRKVGHLLLAFDCVINKMFDLEDEKDEKVLKAVTGDDLECWWALYDQASEAVLRAIVNQCRDVQLRDIKIKRLRDESLSTCKSLGAAREKARARYDEMQKEAADVEQPQK